MIPILTVLALTGCGKGDIREVEFMDTHCKEESSERRADFILKCISNANPLSDEEPEDWITQCKYMAEETFCPSITFIVTERCVTDLGCIWREVKRHPKNTKQ